jgi:4,5:9,10-diseco-3-hydroxy-5,9,17-trioxoandrosta-1(10),2-diene-4-oate hydrolase
MNTCSYIRGPACHHADIGPCRFLTAKGLTIHLVEAGDGPALLLVHGGQGWAYTWRRQLGPLADAGYLAIAPDLPGSGYSDLVGHEASIEGLSRFLGDLLDALEIERAAFVANSAGGLPVLDFALRRPERVAALVLASSCGAPHTEPVLWRLLRWPLLGEVMGLFVTAGMVRSNLRQMVYDESLIGDEVVTAYLEPLRRPGAWRANLKLERNWRPGWVEANLEQITAPTLVVWGQDDPWHPLSMAHEFGQRLADAQVEILPECGHLPHEERPADFDRLVLEFLAKRLPGKEQPDE